MALRLKAAPTVAQCYTFHPSIMTCHAIRIALSPAHHHQSTSVANRTPLSSFSLLAQECICLPCQLSPYVCPPYMEEFKKEGHAFHTALHNQRALCNALCTSPWIYVYSNLRFFVIHMHNG
ncbi:hypothetical protein TSMEX_005533 [Taenia solium]|eukprot:TsM_000327400 transcript=TsM_000327400 gene=TsM_000327400